MMPLFISLENENNLYLNVVSTSGVDVVSKSSVRVVPVMGCIYGTFRELFFVHRCL